MKIIKNLLSKEEFLKIKTLLESKEFPWFYNDAQVSKTDDIENLNQKDGVWYDGFTDDNESFFCHQFYLDGTPASQFYSNLLPLINSLEPVALVNIKANLNINKNRNNSCGWHRDIHRNKKLTHKTAIFYINTNNGYTELENNEKIISEENKLLIFDSIKLHRACQQTDTDTRIVININYF